MSNTLNRVLKTAVACAVLVTAAPWAGATTNRVTAGLVALYEFQETNGSVVADGSGFGAPLDLVIQDTQSVARIPGGGLHVLATNLVISSAPAAKVVDAWRASGAFTVEAWIRPDAPSVATPGLILSVAGSATDYDVKLVQDGDRYAFSMDGIETELGGDSIVWPFASAQPRASHLVVTRDAAGLTRAFLNGTLAAEVRSTGAVTNWDDSFPLALAADAAGTAPWKGRYYIVACYERALTEDEVQQNYDLGPQAPRLFIVDEPQDVLLIEPDPATFAVGVLGAKPIAYSWKRDGLAVSGATGASYTLAPTLRSRDNGARFSVTASNALGTAVSREATLTVEVYVPHPPYIVNQPGDVVVTEPDPAVFAVTAGGDQPIGYQWRRNGAAVPGATNDVYVLYPTTHTNDDGARFEVVVSNPYGSITSRLAYLAVDLHVPGPPYIEQHPFDLTVPAPAPAEFHVVARGDPPLAYQWRRNATNLVGATNTTYTLGSTEYAADNGARFDAIVSNPYGAVTSQTAVLTVVRTDVPPTIDAQPADLAVTEPTAAIFSVAASGPTPLSYQWRRDGTNLTDGTLNVYALNPTVAARDDGARFDVIVSNPYGSVTSRLATLTVNAYVPRPPGIVGQPGDVTVTEPAPAGFSVLADGDAPLSYQWRRDGADLAGATTAAYTLSPTVAARDNGARFDVIVSNPYGSATSRLARLTVHGLPGPEPPSIVTEPVDVTVTAPLGAGFSVLAAGDAPIYYQWRRDGTNIAGARFTAYALAETSVADNGSRFSVLVSNAVGSVTSRVATLTVRSPPEPQPPRILRHPTSVTVTAPEGAGFAVLAAGGEPLSYQWRRNGANLPGAVFSAYALTATVPADNGARFTVVVSNALGTVTSWVARLTVRTANLFRPVIRPPGAKSVLYNSTLTFTVSASDADGTVPTLKAPLKPTGAQFTDRHNGTGTFTWKPQALAALGDNPVRFVASDGKFTVTNRLSVHVRSFTVTNPVAGTRLVIGRGLRVAWAGQWPLATATLDLWRGTNLSRHLAASAPAAARAGVWQGTLPTSLNPGSGYWVSVIDKSNPDDYAYSATFTLLRRRLLNDFNNDGRSDLAVFNARTAKWYVRSLSGQTYVWGAACGPAGATPVPGDYDGDRKADLAVYDARTAKWTIRTAAGRSLAAGIAFGWAGVTPVPGDYNGDGRCDLALYDAAAGKWYIRTVGGASIAWGRAFGWAGVTPVPGDFNNDGRSDLALFDRTTGKWHMRTVSGTVLAQGVAWGWAAATPVPGDYNGDGRGDLAVFDGTTGKWYIRTLAGRTLASGISWGWRGATPVPGDYNNDGKTDLAVFDGTTGKWYVRTVSGTTLAWGSVCGSAGAKALYSD